MVTVEIDELPFRAFYDGKETLTLKIVKDGDHDHLEIWSEDKQLGYLHIGIDKDKDAHIHFHRK